VPGDTNFTGTGGYSNAAELARISAALIAAMSEARTMVEAGDFALASLSWCSTRESCTI
jgi:hypothetical protein